jgi:hypothetical protein
MTQFDRLANRLYGENGMGCGDVKVFLGLRNASSEEIAEQINIFLDDLETGAVDIVDGDEADRRDDFARIDKRNSKEALRKLIYDTPPDDTPYMSEVLRDKGE